MERRAVTPDRLARWSGEALQSQGGGEPRFGAPFSGAIWPVFAGQRRTGGVTARSATRITWPGPWPARTAPVHRGPRPAIGDLARERRLANPPPLPTLGPGSNLVSAIRPMSRGRMNHILKERRRMRKLVVGTFLTLDGVLQGPGGPEEELTPGATPASPSPWALPSSRTSWWEMARRRGAGRRPPACSGGSVLLLAPRAGHGGERLTAR